MRRSPKVTLLEDVPGEPYGLCLAADYCAQHEWGVEGIERAIGAEPGDRPAGLPSRTGAGAFADKLFIGEAEVTRPVRGRRRSRREPPAIACRGFGIHRYMEIEGGPAFARMAAELLPPEDAAPVGGCWDGDGFCVVAYDGHHAAVLDALAGAARAGRLAAWVGGAGWNPFDRGSLVVVDPAAVPAARAEEMLAFDRARNALLDAASATGIEARLDAAAADGADDRFRLLHPHRLSRYALTPRWAGDSGRAADTAHPVVFWLNPMDQEASVAGWYTVEELDAWRDGRGPVVGKGRGRAANGGNDERQG